MVVNFTCSSGSTGAGVTRVRPLYTLLTLANVASVAIIINNALRATASDSVRLRNEARLAFADGIVIRTHPTRGSRSTGGWMAGIGLLNTLLALTDIASSTICIYDAFWPASSDCVWFGNISRQAVANRVSGTVDLTSGSWATWTGIAGIRLLNAFLILADIARVTVIVSHALWTTTSDCVWLWNQTRKAMAN